MNVRLFAGPEREHLVMTMMISGHDRHVGYDVFHLNVGKQVLDADDPDYDIARTRHLGSFASSASDVQLRILEPVMISTFGVAVPVAAAGVAEAGRD